MGAAVAFAAPDVLATPVQGLRGAISNSTGEARHLSDPGDDVESGGDPGDDVESGGDPGEDVESGGGKTCCKNGNDNTNCEIHFRYLTKGSITVCKDSGWGRLRYSRVQRALPPRERRR